ncbi:MAG: T9SS type A sorting domain-containing protein [Saprospiraceae bacterium]|nr:T9SS type A sorting domain-containing protein [Saprospiraceae bacterium]MDZ4706258.1 T9SS type A sorting domain-containing protein [Saprospiraceae bacterium]
MKNSVLWYSFTGVLLASTLTFGFFINKNSYPTKVPLKVDSIKIRFFDWESQIGNIDLANIYSNVEFIPTQEKSNSKDIAYFDKIYRHAFPESKLLKIHNDIQHESTTLDLSDKVFFPVSMAIDHINDAIYIGDSGNKKVIKINNDGEVLKEYHVGFYFLDFNYSSKENKFIFYSPMQSAEIKLPHNNTILVLNENMEILHSLFPLGDLYSKNFPIHINAFKKSGDKTYFNPPLTGDIFELSYDGTYKKILIFPGANEKKLLNDVLAASNESGKPNIEKVFAVNEKMPIIDYLVGEKEIIFERYFNGIRYNIIIDKSSGRGVAISPGMPIDDFGKEFKFVFKSPKFSSTHGFITQISNADCNVVGETFESKQIKIPAYLSEAIKNQQGLLMVHDYDFDFLYDHSTDDLTPIAPNFGHLSENVEVSLAIRDLKISPNPLRSNGKLNIEFTYPDALEADISLTSLWGTIIVNQQKLSSNGGGRFATTFDLDQCTPGTYFILIRPSNGKMQSKQIVVQ